ncbi:MAG: DUF4412 domain-containing protein [Verrucomicrobiota bacterium]
MKNIYFIFLTLFFLTNAWAQKAPFIMADEYSVEMISQAQGKQMRNKMFVAPQKVRVESNVEGQQMIMISRVDRHVAYHVMPAQGMYMEMALPKEAMRQTGKVPDDAVWKHIGSEKINGQDCDKYEVVFAEAGKNFKTFYWIGKDSHYPVRLSSEGYVTDWVNFKPATQPNHLFEPPPGMKKMSMGNMMNMMQQGMDNH